MSSILGSSDARINEASTSAFRQTLFEFFNEKVEAVRRAAGGSPADLEPLAASFAEFEQWTLNAVEKVIQSAASKSCSLDPMPTTILKRFLPELVQFVTRMCNASLKEGILSLSQRHVIVSP